MPARLAMSSLSDDDFFDRVFSPVFGEGAGAEVEEVGFFVGVVEEGMLVVDLSEHKSVSVRPEQPHAKSVSHRLWRPSASWLARPDTLCERVAT